MTAPTTTAPAPAAPAVDPVATGGAVTVARDAHETPAATALRAAERTTLLPLAEQQELERRRARNTMATAIAAQTWGRNLDVATTRAIAEYAHRYGIDPLTELDVLGGNLYVNSEYWLRRLGELRAQGIILDFRLVHIHHDARLLEIASDPEAPQDMRDDARRQHYAAKLARAQHNVPEGAEAACVCRITLVTGGSVVEGVKWGGGGTSVLQARSGRAAEPNPIVENNAALSVESQAVRRAMRQVASYLPATMPDPERMAADLKDLGAQITATKASAKLDRAATADDARGRQIEALADPYAVEPATKRLAAAPVAEAVVESAPAPVRPPAAGNDPYDAPPTPRVTDSTHPVDGPAPWEVVPHDDGPLHPSLGATDDDGAPVIMSDPDGPPAGWEDGPSVDALNDAAEAAEREAATEAFPEPVQQRDPLADGPTHPVPGERVAVGDTTPRIVRVLGPIADEPGTFMVKIFGDDNALQVSWDQARGMWSAE